MYCKPFLGAVGTPGLLEAIAAGIERSLSNFSFVVDGDGPPEAWGMKMYSIWASKSGESGCFWRHILYNE